MKGLLSKAKPLTLVVVALLVVVGAAAFLLPKVMPGTVNISFGASKAGAEAVVQKTPTPESGIPLSLGERIVNLADPGGYRYLKTEIVLELTVEKVDTSKLSAEQIKAEQQKLDAELDPVKPKIQDVLTTVLSSKTVAEVSSAEGKEALKRELAQRIQPLLEHEHVIGVYFAQFVIQ